MEFMKKGFCGQSHLENTEWNKVKIGFLDTGLFRRWCKLPRGTEYAVYPVLTWPQPPAPSILSGCIRRTFWGKVLEQRKGVLRRAWACCREMLFSTVCRKNWQEEGLKAFTEPFLCARHRARPKKWSKIRALRSRQLKQGDLQQVRGRAKGLRWCDVRIETNRQI